MDCVVGLIYGGWCGRVGHCACPGKIVSIWDAIQPIVRLETLGAAVVLRGVTPCTPKRLCLRIRSQDADLQWNIRRLVSQGPTRLFRDGRGIAFVHLVSEVVSAQKYVLECRC